MRYLIALAILAGMSFAQTTAPKNFALPTTISVTTGLPTGVTLTGVLATTSDGKIVSMPVGGYLVVSGGKLVVTMAAQYVGDAAVRQIDGSWKYLKAGRNVQVWRNGILQMFGVDYTLDTAKALVLPKLIAPDGITAIPDWSDTDVIQVAYLF